MEYPKMKYLANLFSISMLKILFWVIFVNLLALFLKKVLHFNELNSLHSSKMRIY